MKTTGNLVKRSKLIVASFLLLILLFSMTFGITVFGGQKGSPCCESSNPAKMKYEITEMERETRNNYLEWGVKNPTFLIIKPTGNQPTIIWTLDHMPQSDRAAFIDELKSFSAANDVVIKPFDLDGEIMWIEGAKVSVDIFPEDDKRGQIDIEVEIKEDEIIKAKFHFQKESTWSQFVVGIVNSFIEVPPTTTEPTTTTTTTTTETPTTETETTTTTTTEPTTTTTTTTTETPTTTTTTETPTTTEPTTTTTTETTTTTTITETPTTETQTTTPVETTTETTIIETTTPVETTVSTPTETLTTSETTTILETATASETTELVTTETEETTVVPVPTVTNTPTQQVETSPLPATGEYNKGWQMALAFLISIIGILILRKSALRSMNR